MKTLSKALTLAILVALVAGTTVSAYAANTEREDSHTGRAQVKDRLAHQGPRIKEQVKQGETSKAAGAALRQEHQAMPAAAAMRGLS